MIVSRTLPPLWYSRMRTADFDFDLPPDRIAQAPAADRDGSRLLVLDRSRGSIEHRAFRQLPGYLRPGDVLVLNDSRVIPARLRGVNGRTGGRFEILLLEEESPNIWWTMMRPGRRARPGTRIGLVAPGGAPAAVEAVVLDSNDEGHRRVEFTGVRNISEVLDTLGELPLPPYINRGDGLHPDDQERYQTVYARPPGSVAAPTAGLHFTAPLLRQLRESGIEVQSVTLHVGLGTFAPVKSDSLEDHRMHEERYEIGADAAAAINRARGEGRRIVAVGTTVVRVLESAAAPEGSVPAGAGRTSIFIHPPRNFRVTGAMLTNFHLPKSTLLMLVSAFAAPGSTRGRDLVLGAYAEAIREGYRFFSYGDAMLVV
ncbi:MAG: tRNA preQ1(34) S-adenosylmethionine ribosyltransferase-isomerase QueA [Verrucomicrobiota bacterium]